MVSKVTVVPVFGLKCSYVIEELLHNTEYQLFLVYYNADGMSNASNLITFPTLARRSHRHESPC